MDTVAFLKCRGSFKETLGEAIDLIGGIGKQGSPLILKPNLCTDNDHTGCANVKVEVIEALVDHILEENQDIEIKIVESDSGSKYADKAFERYGYRAYVDRLSRQKVNVAIQNLSKSPLTRFDYDGC